MVRPFITGRPFVSGRPYVTGRGTATPSAGGGTPSEGGGGPPEEPPSPTAPAILEGPLLVSRTTTSITLEWTADQFVQAWVEYGLTTGYGTESTHETSFNYKRHVQQISGLDPDTTYHFRVHVVNQAAQETVGDDATFDTVAPPVTDPEWDTGHVYISTHPWPTGDGWTAGALATISANVNALIASAGNGTDLTHTRKHVPARGAEYPIDTYIALDNRKFLTFDGDPVSTSDSSPFGHTGGATIKSYNNSGSSTRQPLFNGGSGPTSRFEGIRWHGLTLKGNATNLASSTAASQNTEKQHGIAGAGGKHCLVDHCIFTDFKGDDIYLSESTVTGSASDAGPSGENCDDWEIRYTQLLQCARQNLAPGQGADNVWVHHCYFADPAYCYVDIEGNKTYQLNSNHAYDDNVFAGKWQWQTTGGPAGLGYHVPAFYFTNIGDGAYFSGYFRLRNNLITGIHNNNNYVYNKCFVASAPWGDFEQRGEVTITGNRKTSAKQAGPIIVMNRYRGPGPFVISGNTDFWTGSGSWLLASNGTLAPTVGGNT